MKNRLNYVGCAGDMAHIFNLLGLVCLLVAVATPAWVDQQLNVPVHGETYRMIFGRGYFQSYEYDQYGTIILYNHNEKDRSGHKMDPFCGSADAVLVSRALALVNVTRNRTTTAAIGA
eukprot:TRINITY_DN8427_c0_g1_i1.p1 TRINITY_DN8427_c0_g1~~TRINITY_DN8427_c0_g1_i1.p1  ORF type:complete len:118 (+),score=24.00 TRINITY_DN8427_c0_g1_i1:59-412(+)